MGCLLPLFALVTPRFILIVLWLFTDYLTRAFETFWIPFFGFFILPTTTIAYAIAQNALGGWSTGGGIIVLLIGFVIDVGLIGSGRGAFKTRRSGVED